VYLGDTARVPYGGKSAETVTRYAIEIANHLIRTRDIKLLVVACNTARPRPSRAPEDYKIPVVGMVDPCVRRAAALPERGRSASSGRSDGSFRGVRRGAAALRSIGQGPVDPVPAARLAGGGGVDR